MSIIVEDGTGLATAESYCTVAYFQTYHTNRGNATGAALTSADIEPLLRKATDYMVQVYRFRWQGYRVSITQALDWPRYQVERKDGPWARDNPYYYSYTIVPTEVQNACAELAWKAYSATDGLAPDLEQQVIKEVIGPITTVYADYSQQTKRYRAIDLMLAPFIKGPNNNFRLVRT